MSAEGFTREQPSTERALSSSEEFSDDGTVVLSAVAYTSASPSRPRSPSHPSSPGSRVRSPSLPPAKVGRGRASIPEPPVTKLDNLDTTTSDDDKDKQLAAAAEIGKALLEKNKDLASQLSEYQAQLSIANKRIHETEETRVLNDRLQTQLTLLQAQLDEAGRLNATLTDEMRAKSQSVQSSNGPSASSEVIAENADLKERVQEYYRFLSQAKQTIETLQTEKNNAISERDTIASEKSDLSQEVDDLHKELSSVNEMRENIKFLKQRNEALITRLKETGITDHAQFSQAEKLVRALSPRGTSTEEESNMLLDRVVAIVTEIREEPQVNVVASLQKRLGKISEQFKLNPDAADSSAEAGTATLLTVGLSALHKLVETTSRAQKYENEVRELQEDFESVKVQSKQDAAAKVKLQQQLDALKADGESQKQMIQSLEDQLKALQAELDAAQNSSSSDKATADRHLSETLAKFSALETKYRELEQQGQSSAAELEALRASEAAAKSKQAELESTVSSQAERLAQLDKEVAEKQSSIDTLQNDVAAKKQEIEKLAAQLKDKEGLSAESAAASEKRLTELEEEVAKKESSLSQLKIEISAAKQEAESLAAQLKEKDSTIALQTNQIDQLTKDVSDKQTAITQLQDQVAAAKHEAERLSGLLKDMDASSEASAAQAEQLTRLEKDVADKEAAISKLQGEISSQQDEIKRLQGLLADKDIAHQADVARLEKQVEEVQEKLDSALKQENLSKAELQTTKATLEADLATLRKELAQLQSSSGSEAAERSKKLSVLEASKSDLEKQLADLLDKLATTEKDLAAKSSTAAENSAKLAEAEARLAKLEAQIEADKKSFEERMKQLKDKETEHQAELAKLKEDKIKSTTAAAAALMDQSTRLETRLTQESQRSRGLGERVQELEQALQDLEAKHAQETAELRSSLEAELAQLRKDLEESQRAAKDAQSAQEALQVQLSREEHLLQQIADLKKQQEEQVAAFSSAESDSTAMLQKLSDLRDQLETEKNSREGLNETIDKEKKNAAAAEARSRELELELAELQQRISQQSGVEDALLGANKERDEALRALDSLNVAHSRLDASNQLLTTENEHLKSRVVSLEEELARMKTLAQSGAVNSPATGIVASSTATESTPAPAPTTPSIITTVIWPTHFADHAVHRFVNKYLGNDAHLKDLLPVPEKSGHVAAAAHNGVLLCKLANLARPGTIDERAINLNPTTDEQIRQNHTLCLASASALGCKVFHITPDQLTFAKDKAPTAMLDLAWELIKVSAFSPINLRDHPEIMALYPKHDPSAVSLKAPDRIILKWLNTMLTRASYKSTVKDFGVDLADGLALLHLFTQISSPTQAKNFLEAAKQPTDVRAAVITQATENLFPGMLCVVRPEDIKNGQGELLMVLLAGLFHQRSGLVDEIGGSPMKSPSGSLLLASPMKPSPMSPLANTNTSSTPTDIPVRKRERKITRVNTIDLDLEGTREERAFCAWINSLGLPGYKFVRNLHKDVANGVVLLEVLEKIAGPAASLNWSKVQREPKHRFACLANCELVVASAKLLGFSLVGISGSDIEGKNRKLILALVWQACLYHLMSILPKTKEGRRADEAYVREWANKMLKENGKTSAAISSFKDPELGKGRYLLDLIDAVEPGLLGDDTTQTGLDDPASNAKLIVSLARKMGCFVFCVWEDIAQVNAKQIFAIVASLLKYHNDHQQ